MYRLSGSVYRKCKNGQSMLLEIRPGVAFVGGELVTRCGHERASRVLVLFSELEPGKKLCFLCDNSWSSVPL